MNRRHLLSSILVASALGLPALAAASYRPLAVDVDIVGARGRSFPVFPVGSEARDVYRAYLQARNQERYRIRVRNRTGERVGLVIAVDGRNIISGDQSDLAPGERMYVLDPWESAEYEGWRTGSERVNEFYFTEWRDSYAEAFGDRSARGVIAVAAYREHAPRRRHEQELRKDSAPAASSPEPAAREQDASGEQGAAGNATARAPSAEKSRAGAAPGTGFGEEVYSPSRRVEFEPERRAASRHFLKYEWREALCRRGVIDCEGGEPNRFWGDDDRFGYAPYPPGRR